MWIDMKVEFTYNHNGNECFNDHNRESKSKYTQIQDSQDSFITTLTVKQWPSFFTDWMFICSYTLKQNVCPGDCARHSCEVTSNR